jgi:hypothetical protein
MSARSLILIMLILLTACASGPPAPGKEFLDEETGNTLTVVSKPIVFARERTDVAAYSRDYATLVAVEVDHAGTFKNYLLLYRWSTVDARMLPKPDADVGELELLGDGRRLDFKPLTSLPIALGSGRDVYLPRHGAALVRAFAVDQATLRYIALTQELTLQMPQEELDTPFRLWEDGRGALAAFLRQTSAP